MPKNEPTAMKLIETQSNLIEQQITLNNQLSAIRVRIKEKEAEINDKITAEVIDYLGRDIQVSTAINEKSAVIRIIHYGFSAVYRDGDMEIDRNRENCDVKLSVLNAVSDSIDKILKAEGLN